MYILWQNWGSVAEELKIYVCNKDLLMTFNIWYIYEIYWTDKDINFVNYPVVTKRSPFLNSMPVTVTQMRVGKSSGDAFMQQNINIHL